MRIVELISGLGNGGAEKALAQRLQFTPRSVETHVVSTSRETSRFAQEISRHATVHRDGLRSIRAIRALDPDLLITHNPREALRVLAHPTLAHQFPVLVVAHNQVSSEFATKALILDSVLPLVNRRAAMHLAVSSSAAEGKQCKNASRVVVSMLGGNINPGSPKREALWPLSTTLRGLVLGRLSPQKNLECLIRVIERSASHLRASGAHFCVVGDGELRPRLTQKVVRSRLTDLITFTGWIDDSDGIVKAADVLLVTSSHEGGPLSVFEALLSGTRVVSTPVGAIPDLVKLRGSSQTRSLYCTRDMSDLQIARELTEAIEPGPVTPDERIARQREFSFLDTALTSIKFYDICSQLAGESAQEGG